MIFNELFGINFEDLIFKIFYREFKWMLLELCGFLNIKFWIYDINVVWIYLLRKILSWSI